MVCRAHTKGIDACAHAHNNHVEICAVKLKDKSKLQRALINHIVDNTLEKDLKKVLKLVDTLPNGEEQTKEKATASI